MRLIRISLFFILAIAVPLQGYASFVVPKVPCPMEPLVMMNMADADAMHDCCNDAETAAKTGKLCKSGQSCQSAGHFLPFLEVDYAPHVLVTSVRYPQIADDLLSFDPAATWRPPAQL